jgi:hypothetical protein
MILASVQSAPNAEVAIGSSSLPPVFAWTFSGASPHSRPGLRSGVLAIAEKGPTKRSYVCGNWRWPTAYKKSTFPNDGGLAADDSTPFSEENILDQQWLW